MMAILYALALFYTILHLFGHTLHHVNLLKWKHLLEKYPDKFRVVLATGGNVAPIRSLFDFYRFVILAGTLIYAVDFLGVYKTTIAASVYFLVITIVTGVLMRGEGAEKSLIYLFPVMKLLVIPLLPFKGLTVQGREDLVEDELPTDEEVNAYISLGKEEGFIEPSEEEMFQSVVDFTDTLAREVMTPRTDMVVVKEDASWNDLVRTFMNSRHSRIPVIGENLDDVKGIILVKDCLEIVYEDKMTKPIHAIMRNPWFVPETKRLMNLLAEMRESHQHMTIVVDEYGGTAGLVTLEDLLEEIVGDISDEHEVDEEEIIELSPGSYSLDGRAHIDVLEDLYDLTIEDVNYDTVGGLLMTLLGNVPPPGSIHSFRGLSFEVLDSDERRIRRVKVCREELVQEEKHD